MILDQTVNTDPNIGDRSKKYLKNERERLFDNEKGDTIKKRNEKTYMQI